MNRYTIRTHRSEDVPVREEQLAWRIAQLACDHVATEDDVADMVVNRLIDNAAVAAASLMRAPVVVARDQARHARTMVGSTVFGEPSDYRVSPDWAAWANGAAVRELDFHDTFLAEEYSHPGDNIAPLVAVAQHLGARYHLSGDDLVRGIVCAYEVQISLCRSISLHRHRIDHVAHLGPSVAAGLGSMLRLPAPVIYHAIGQALHTTTATRQSRKGSISTWKAHAPGFAAKAAIEAVDRAMRGQTAPAPIYEGEDGVIAWLLGGPDAQYEVSLASSDEPRRAIMDSYTKEYSAEYQAQSWIDLARRWHEQYPQLRGGETIADVLITTSHHTHQVIGSGARDREKYDPHATRETLDHSLPYIFTVAFQDGCFDHRDSYSPQRATRPDTVALWSRVRTREDAEWSRRYLCADPATQAFGGHLSVTLSDGTVIEDEILVPDAHPHGARPFSRPQYTAKLRTLASENVGEGEVERFLSVAEGLTHLASGEFFGLTLSARPGLLDSIRESTGVF